MKNSIKSTQVNFKDSFDGIGDDITSLILEIEKADIVVTNCICHPKLVKDWIWIHFFACYEAMRFLDIVAIFNVDTNSIYCRALRDRGDNDWKYDISPTDLSFKDRVVDTGENEHGHQVEEVFDFQVSIGIPIKDRPIVEHRLREYNSQPKPIKEETE